MIVSDKVKSGNTTLSFWEKQNWWYMSEIRYDLIWLLKKTICNFYLGSLQWVDRLKDKEIDSGRDPWHDKQEECQWHFYEGFQFHWSSGQYKVWRQWRHYW